MSDIYINWQEYHQKIEQLALKIYESKWEFNHLICIAKGGLRIGDILARIYQKPLAIMIAKSYIGKGNQTQSTLEIAPNLASLNNKIDGKILLVDDLVDSGITLQDSINWLQKKYPEITEIRSGVIWYKKCSKYSPDYYIEYLEKKSWIHQPFEKYEGMNPQKLKQI